MLGLTERERYAVLALVDVAQQEGRGAVPLRDIAARRAVPLPFLERIAAELRRAGFLRAKRGPGGGVLLARPAAEIRLGDVLRAAVAPTTPRTPRGGGADRALSEALHRARAAAEATLDGIFLDALARRAAALDGGPAGDEDFVI